MASQPLPQGRGATIGNTCSRWIGRIAGIPIYLDMMFVLVLLFFTYPYFTGGNTQMMSAGFIIVIGLLLSILLHELGHAFAGRLFNAHVSHIDLTGIGGVAHFERSLPASAFARTVIYLAGPAVNLGLWSGLGALAGETYQGSNPMVALAARGAGLGQLRPADFQPAAGLSARRRPYARCPARRRARRPSGPSASSPRSAWSWPSASPTARCRPTSSCC